MFTGQLVGCQTEMLKIVKEIIIVSHKVGGIVNIGLITLADKAC